MQSIQRPQNPRGPKVLVNVCGMMRSPRAAERCDRSAPLSDTRESISERYGGASPRKQRKTSKQSLNEIRCRIGSQCNLLGPGNPPSFDF